MADARPCRGCIAAPPPGCVVAADVASGGDGWVARASGTATRSATTSDGGGLEWSDDDGGVERGRGRGQSSVPLGTVANRSSRVVYVINDLRAQAFNPRSGNDHDHQVALCVH